MEKLKKYVNDYETKEILTKTGKKKVETVYVGDYYGYQFTSSKLTTFKFICATCTSLLVLLFLACGFINYGASHNFVVVIPYAISVIPIVYNILGTFTLLSVKDKMTRRDKDSSAQRMMRSCIAIVIIYTIILITNIIYLIMHYESLKFKDESIFLACIIGILFAAGSIIYLQVKNPCYNLTEKDA